MRRVLAAAIVFAGCASAGANGETVPGPRDCLTGTVAAEGPEVAERTMLTSDSGERTELTGPQARNVRLLTGALATVCGSVSSTDRALEVDSVELLEVDGRPAHLGTLVQSDGGFEIHPLGGGSPVTLSTVPDALRAAEGRVVWVAGTSQDGRVRVQAFGTLSGWSAPSG